MRRAAVQVLRHARRPLIRSVLLRGHGLPFKSTNDAYGLVARNTQLRRERNLRYLQSSMYFRPLPVAVLSGLAASGAWYFAYKDIPASAAAATSQYHSVAQHTASVAEHLSSAATHSAAAAAEAVEATRRALVLDRGQLYTGTITGDAPLSKDTDDNGRKVLEMVTPEQATQRLRRGEESYFVGRGKGVVRYDIVQLASNDPIEDDHAEKIVAAPGTQSDSGSDWSFWGVFDGHSGWTTSAKLRTDLINFVARELNSTYGATTKTGALTGLPSAASIDAAIKRGFLALDSTIVNDSVTEVLRNKSKPQAASLLAPALSGSCALLSFYDSASQTLRVACTGDSRAVLGRRSLAQPAKWTAVPLSVDQTGGNLDEAARLRREHPDEPGVVRAGRVLGGLEPTRAFGDATYKWSVDIQERIKDDFFGRTPNSMIRTPPYVTAEPVITTTKVQPDRGDFVVMATDGLWEMLTNEEVVGLVGQWLEQHPTALGSGHDVSARSSSSWLKSWWNPSPNNLPVQGNSPDKDAGGQRAPIRQQQWGLTPSTGKGDGTPASSRFVVEDNNVATHLIRNALGGRDRDMVCALLTLPAPYARRYRDDLTVEVIFFGDREGVNSAADNAIVVNEDATAKVRDDPRAKL